MNKNIQKYPFGICFEIFNNSEDSNYSDYSNEIEDEKQVIEIDELKNDPYKIKYIIYHNNKIKYTFDSKDQAIKIVESEINEITNYYSKIDSVYTLKINNENDIYTISAHYEFQNIKVDTVFETFKIVKNPN